MCMYISCYIGTFGKNWILKLTSNYQEEIFKKCAIGIFAREIYCNRIAWPSNLALTEKKVSGFSFFLALAKLEWKMEYNPSCFHLDPYFQEYPCPEYYSVCFSLISTS